MKTDQEQREAALGDLHMVIADTRIIIDRNHAVMMMAIRYGDARVECARAIGASHVKWDLANRARSRRFAALHRLVYGGAR